MFNKPTSASKVGLLNKSSCLAATLNVTQFIIGQFVEKNSCLAPTLGVTNFIIVTDIILVTL